MQRIWRSWLSVAVLCAAIAFASPAQSYDGPIFDAHLHYNWEPKPFYEPEIVLALFRRNQVTGILATSRPNTGTQVLVEMKPADLWIVPFIRPYRIRADIPTWFNDPAIYELVINEYKRGYYRGIGEFHIYGKAATSDWVKKLVQFAVENGLYLHAHCDVEALEILFAHDPRARIIWAHSGFSTPVTELAALFDKYKGLTGELSYRGGITEPGGKITPEWKELFATHSGRFLLGSDTWIAERWFSYESIMKNYRNWLGQIPREQADRIAHGNAERLFRPAEAAQ
jgi:hypothetical protein